MATIASGFMLILPSCHIPCLRDPEPGPELPETFNGRVSDENSAQVSIPEFFNDPVLTCLINEGLVGNQQLKILAEDIQIANNEILSRRGAYLPFFNIGAGAGVWKPSFYTPQGAVEDQLNFLPGQGFPTPLPNFMVASDLSWQIDIWRQLRNARDAATLRYLGTIDGRTYVVTRLVADIAENYYTLMALDKRLENLDAIIQLQEKSLELAKARKEGTRGTELPVQRFLAEVRRNNSEKLIIKQDIIEAENRINFMLGRYPMPVERNSDQFFELVMPVLNVGIPSQMLLNRPDIRQAERQLAAAGLDIKVARARFYPTLNITGTVGFEAFNPKYLFISPESLVGGVAGSLVAPLINRLAIKADYMSANARQLQALINYQKTTLNAFTEVINRISMVENYGKSIDIKKQQIESLEKSVDVATRLFQAARAEYLDVLYAQRDMMDARMVLIETKRMQLSAVVNTYQALGGGQGGLTSVFDGELAPIPADAIPIEELTEDPADPEPAPILPAPTPTPMLKATDTATDTDTDTPTDK